MLSANKSRRVAGDTLIEVVVVAFMIMTSFIAMASLATVSLTRNITAKERVVATRLAQEGLEYLRSERNRLGFSSFQSNVDVFAANGHSYVCIDEISLAQPTDVSSLTPLDTPTDLSVCSTLGGRYKRYVRMLVGADTVTAIVHVVWPGTNHEVVLSTQLNKWQSL